MFRCRSLCVLMAAFVLTTCIPGTESRKRAHRHSRRNSCPPHDNARDLSLPDPSLLLIPAVLKKMESEGLIYRDTHPDYRWIVERIDHSKDFDHSCTEVVYATVVLEREPTVRYHRTCDSPQPFTSEQPRIPCVTIAPGKHTDKCQPQKTYHIVKLAGLERYQETFTGCVCNSSKLLTRN
ncbi:hypothetical protein ACOMHN_064539 [Nucella lapillus]